MRTYDPYKLITQTRALLGTLPGTADDETLALTGACMLLRGLGIVPAADPLGHYAWILDSPSWPDSDDQAAEESRHRAALRDLRTSGGA